VSTPQLWFLDLGSTVIFGLVLKPLCAEYLTPGSALRHYLNPENPCRIFFVCENDFVMTTETIELPLSEYQRMQEELSLLKNSELLKKVNQLVDSLYQDKYGFYMGDFTDDLTEFTVDNSWEDQAPH